LHWRGIELVGGGRGAYDEKGVVYFEQR